jgi:hypothetical protein
MIEVLAMASLIAPVTSGLVQIVKKSGISNGMLPFLAVVIGVGLGAGAFSFVDLQLVERLWAGGISGLAAVGVFELGKNTVKEMSDNEL